MSEALSFYQEVWRRKPVLRILYNDIFDRIAARCRPGRTLEIGGGIGNLKERIGDVVTTDIQRGAWMDVVADAQRLPFTDYSFDNIVMLDVLHHIEFPGAFFREASRVLRPGGRIVMVEPAITLGSTLFFRLLHHEPVDMSADPLADGVPSPHKDPYDSNQAIPTLILGSARRRFLAMFPQFRIVEYLGFSFMAYPLSGGFKPWSAIPSSLAPWVLRVERGIEPLLGKWLGFRLLAVIAKAD